MIKYDDLFPKQSWEISEPELSEQLRIPCNIIFIKPVQTTVSNSRPRSLSLLIQDKKDLVYREKGRAY